MILKRDCRVTKFSERPLIVQDRPTSVHGRLSKNERP
jgi:hypothetical protein